MTGMFSNLMNTAVCPTVWTETANLTELVRGSEQALLDRLTPLTHRQSIILDLSRVERIDAAGIAALISLHASAYESGHCFTVVNPTHRVAEILSLVGLERILLSRNAARESHSGERFERPAA